MKKFVLAVTTFVLFTTSAAFSQTAITDWLITPIEATSFKGEEGFNEPIALRPRGLVPSIDVIRPDPTIDTKIKAPFAINVVFRPQPDAAIDPTSFRVLYGALRVDITGRITKFVKVSPTGFLLENAQIPAGKHRLTLQVQDEKQRVAERELRVDVE